VVVVVIEVAGVASAEVVVATEVARVARVATVIMRPKRIKLLTLELLFRSREKERFFEEGLRPTIVWLDVLI